MEETSSDASRDSLEFQKIVLVTGVALMIIKFAAYLLTNSVSILTDATESIVNVMAGLVGIYALMIACKAADKDHPYGHGKIESVSAIVEGTMICVAGALIIMESIKNILSPQGIQSLDIGIVLVAFAGLVNYIVGRAGIAKGKRNNSPALIAGGKHLCSDTYSSIGLIVGLAVMYLLDIWGMYVPWLDPAIASLFGLIIMYTGIKVLKKCAGEILDKADPELLGEVVDRINDIRRPSWVDIHNLRAIKYGSGLHVDLHLTVDPDMTVLEEEGEKRIIIAALRERFGNDTDVTVSVEPCEEHDCVHCNCECDQRQHNFVKFKQWNVDRLTDTHQLKDE